MAEDRNIMLVPEPQDIAHSPNSSVFTAISGAIPSPTSGFESAQSDAGGSVDSFHTASSIEDSSGTEKEEEEFTDVNLDETLIHSSSTTHESGERGTAARSVYNLPPGFESQPKLALKENSIKPIREKPLLPDDSIIERISRVQGDSYEPTRRRPSIDIPNETTPLMTQHSYTPDVSISNQSDKSCCIIF